MDQKSGPRKLLQFGFMHVDYLHTHFSGIYKHSFPRGDLNASAWIASVVSRANFLSFAHNWTSFSSLWSFDICSKGIRWEIACSRNFYQTAWIENLKDNYVGKKCQWQLDFDVTLRCAENKLILTNDILNIYYWGNFVQSCFISSSRHLLTHRRNEYLAGERLSWIYSSTQEDTVAHEKQLCQFLYVYMYTQMQNWFGWNTLPE